MKKLTADLRIKRMSRIGAWSFEKVGLIPQLQQQDKNAVHQRDDENAGCGPVAARIDVDGEEHHVGQQAQAAQRCDEPVFGNKILQKFAEGNRRKFDII